MNDLLREPTAAEIRNASWAWRNDLDRETDGSDDRYFETSWRSLPGLRAYVTREIEASDLRNILGEALQATEVQQ